MSSAVYEIEAENLEEGMSTSDGQDILDVHVGCEWVVAHVYTPRVDDPYLDAVNRGEPEARMWRRGDAVELMDFPDTLNKAEKHPLVREVS
jgi:hypothetical protein